MYEVQHLQLSLPSSAVPVLSSSSDQIIGGWVGGSMGCFTFHHSPGWHETRDVQWRAAWISGGTTGMIGGSLGGSRSTGGSGVVMCWPGLAWAKPRQAMCLACNGLWPWLQILKATGHIITSISLSIDYLLPLFFHCLILILVLYLPATLNHIYGAVYEGLVPG